MFSLCYIRLEMQTTETRNNPFMKAVGKQKQQSDKIPSRWANLDIGEEVQEKKNSFIKRKDDDSGIFSSDKGRGNFHFPKKTFMRFTKPPPPPKPKEFNLTELEEAEEFPALGM